MGCPSQQTHANKTSPQVGEFYFVRSLRSGAEVNVAGAGNLLLDLADVRSRDLAFEEDVGLAGGEDNLFTRRLSQAGARIVWCAEARAFGAAMSAAR